MGFNELIGKLFGNKNTRDMREIQPWVEKAKKAYITIEMLTNDELRAKTQELKERIKQSATEENAKILELKAKVEETEIEERERLFTEIDKLETAVLDKYEVVLDEILPEAFAIVKATAKRFAENEEVIVTATDMDRTLAATKDFASRETRPSTRTTGKQEAMTPSGT